MMNFATLAFHTHCSWRVNAIFLPSSYIAKAAAAGSYCRL